MPLLPSNIAQNYITNNADVSEARLELGVVLYDCLPGLPAKIDLWRLKVDLPLRNMWDVVQDGLSHVQDITFGRPGEPVA